MVQQISTSVVDWKRCYRIIPTRFPTVNLYERVADQADWDMLNSLEAMTNDRMRVEVPQVEIASHEEWELNKRVFIDGCFGHPSESRFSNGLFAVFYAAHSMNTAIAETKYHKERFMRATSEPATNIEMVALKAHVKGKFHDLRGMQSSLPDIYHPSDYGAANRLGAELYEQKSNGVVFNSVRLSGGECVGAFNRDTVQSCQINSYILYIWDGSRIVRVMKDIDS